MGSQKKVAQAGRRIARKEMAGFREALHKKLDVFNDCLTKRPKYIPRKVWRWLSSFFVDIEKIERVLSNKPADEK